MVYLNLSPTFSKSTFKIANKLLFYQVNINNKCIFIMTNGATYINLESTFFSKFFDLPETVEFNSNEDIQEDTNEDINSGIVKTLHSTNVSPLNEILCANKNNTDVLDNGSDTNSELSYELYCYSDEEP